jgi:hypothetical protein
MEHHWTRGFVGVLAFIVVWLIGTAIVTYFYKSPDVPPLMFFGFVVGLMSRAMQSLIEGDVK